MKRICSILFVILMFIFLSACSKYKDHTYKIIETYRITSSNGSISYLSVDLPINYGYQTVSDIQIDNVGNYSYEQKDGYQTLLAEILGDGTEKLITITYEVTLLYGIKKWNGEMKNDYLIPTEFIDSNHQNIVDVAKTLMVEGDQYKTAQKISEYVSKNIGFDYSPKINQKTLLASEVLERKQGVCEDYANLMTALLRASGIPAKSISGLVFNDLQASSDWTSPAGSHAWVEFYINDQWYFADPTWGDRYFAKSDGFHLSYGAQIANVQSQAYQDYINDIENKGLNIIGAMTAPIKFVAWSDDESATIIPKVEVIKK